MEESDNNASDESDSDDDVYLSWDDNELAHEIAKISFEGTISQILLQAYCSFVSTQQATLHHIFVCGVYFWHLQFSCPSHLEVVNPAVFDISCLSGWMKMPTVLVAGQRIFSSSSQFSDGWLTALKIAGDSHGMQEIPSGLFAVSQSQTQEETQVSL